MKTIRIKIYKFHELSEKAQSKAIESLYDINVDHEWWDSTYEDAATIGLKITGFDLGRASYCKGELTYSLTEACNLIFSNHGDNCATYNTAKSFLAEWDKLVKEHSDGNRVCEDKEYEFDQLADELENKFTLALCEDYRIILQREYEYLTSNEAVKDTIIANEYDFTIDGKIF